MARFSSYSARGRRRRRMQTLYLGVAVVVFGGILYYLFWGDSPASEEATDADGQAATVAAEDTPRETPRLAAEANPTRQSAPSPSPSSPPSPTPQERFSQALPSAPSRQTAGVTEARPETTPAPVPQTLPVVTEAAVAPTETDPRAQQVVSEAMALLTARPRQVIAARDKLNETLSMELSADQRRIVKATMAKLSEEWLFGPSAFSGDTLCETYTVKRGDLLQVIGRRHKVPYQILLKINNIPRPESLQAGKAIKVINGPFHVKVCRSTFTMDIYLRDTYVRSFKVGLGRPGYDTPTGLWRVQEGGKLIKPTWTDPDSGRVYQASDPDYPLGSRWIALDGLDGDARGRTGFAIHGTKNPEQIGMAGSRGCIRMYNGECVLVYNMLFPLYSKVEVFD